MEMPERKHEPTHFISDIKIPPDFEAVHCFQHDPEADINCECPPTEAKVSGRIIHWYDVSVGRRRISTDCADCTETSTQGRVRSPEKSTGTVGFYCVMLPIE
jgi:hypothetical protein